MIFSSSCLEGVKVIDLEAHKDSRGFFARSFCVNEFAANGIDISVVQMNLSYNHRRGTLRGMHLQVGPYAEPKLVRCTSGRIFDVVVDLRPASHTYLQWEGFELNAIARRSVYIPEGCAHGFQTLSDNSEVLYLMGASFAPEAARGFRYDDPAFGIVWPEPVTVVSPKDLSYPPYSP